MQQANHKARVKRIYLPTYALEHSLSDTSVTAVPSLGDIVCIFQKLELSSEHFDGNDIVELSVRGTSPACLRVIVKQNTFHRSSVKVVKMHGLPKIMLRSNSFRRTPLRGNFTVDFRNVEVCRATVDDFRNVEVCRALRPSA